MGLGSVEFFNFEGLFPSSPAQSRSQIANVIFCALFFKELELPSLLKLPPPLPILSP